MNQLPHLILTVLIAALVAALVPHARTTAPTKHETAFERVMRTRTLRCAYGIWPPLMKMDPNTKKLSGIDYEIVESIGRVASLKIDWQDEVGVGAVPDQLESGKQDVMCVTLWENARRAQRLETTKPTYYMPLYAYVREGNHRFDNKAQPINDEKASIALVDGAAQKAIADGSFPKAKQYSLPPDTDASHSLLAVATGKADIVFADESAIADYNATNPKHKLRRVEGLPPLRIYGDVFAVAKRETELRDLLNAALDELRNDGTIDRILDSYKTASGAILRPAPVYTSAP